MIVEKVIVEQDEVGRGAGNVGAALAHGDADVRRLQRRSVVDPIAGHGHDMSARLQRLRDPQLVGWGDAADDDTVVVPERTELCGVVGEVLALEHSLVSDDKADLASDRKRRRGMIPGEHRQPDPGDTGCGDGIADAVPGRVVQPDQAEQIEPGFGLIGVGTVGNLGGGSSCDRQHTKTSLGHCGHRSTRIVADHPDAAWQHRVRCPFDHQLGRGQNRFTPPQGVEGIAAQHCRLVGR